MHRTTRSKRTVRKNFKRKKRGVKSFRNTIVRIQPNTLNRQVTAFSPLEMPDREITTFEYTGIARQTFNVNAASGGLAFYMTSCAQESSGVAAAYAYFTEKAAPYIYYRVKKSRIKVTFWSLEAAKYQQIILVPSVNSAVPAGAGSFSGLASQPWAKSCILAPTLTTGAIQTLTHEFAPSKLFGREYYDQDEYAGNALAVSTPTTPGYWILAFYNPLSNTVTTGGIYYSVELMQTVELYQLNRTDSNTLRYNENSVESVDGAISRLESVSKKLRRLSL